MAAVRLSGGSQLHEGHHLRHGPAQEHVSRAPLTRPARDSAIVVLRFLSLLFKVRVRCDERLCILYFGTLECTSDGDVSVRSVEM